MARVLRRWRTEKVLRSGGTPLTITEVAALSVTWASEPRWQADDTILSRPTSALASGGFLPLAERQAR
jgi:hypothetical protein